MDQLTVDDVLTLVAKHAQWCRENGEGDMRNVLNNVRAIRAQIQAGKSRAEIMADDEEDDES